MPGWFRDIYIGWTEGKEEPVCPLDRVIECDRDYIKGYRNKSEFTIGREFAGIGKTGEIVVGFNKGNMSKGIIYVDKPDNIQVVSEESKQVAKSIEKLVRQFNEKYGIEPYDRINNKGFWRILLHRESKKTKEAMISIIVSEVQN